MYLEGKDENGKQASWTLELGGVQALTRSGWSKTMFKQGEQITVDGWLAKDGSASASVKSVKLANGKELSGASSFFESAPVSRQARR